MRSVELTQPCTARRSADHSSTCCGVHCHGAVAPDELVRREGVAVDGDAGAVTELFAYLDSPDPDFAIVTP